MTNDQDLILASWRRCSCAGLRPDADPAASAEQLAGRLARFAPEIAAFERCMEPVRADLPRLAAFLLCDGEGLLLKKNSGRRPCAAGAGSLAG